MGRVLSRAVSRWSRSPGCCGFRGVFWMRRDFSCLVRVCFVFFFERTRPAASMRPSCLIYLSTSKIISSALLIMAIRDFQSVRMIHICSDGRRLNAAQNPDPKYPGMIQKTSSVCYCYSGHHNKIRKVIIPHSGKDLVWYDTRYIYKISLRRRVRRNKKAIKKVPI